MEVKGSTLPADLCASNEPAEGIFLQTFTRLRPQITFPTLQLLPTYI